MDIPHSILQELKCSRCDSYLSRSPVYLQADEKPVCGKCYTPEYPALRNKPYETVAQFIKFPCKYEDMGCPETIPFDSESQAHEGCEYRKYTCPILGANCCDWLGRRDAILNHCMIQHLDRVVLNQGTLAYDFSQSNLKNYLLVAFNLLFLLHTKICLTSDKIYHSVRYIGDAALAAKYYFNVNVNYNNSIISRERDVEPEDFLTIHEHSCIHLKLNSLIDVLGGYEGAEYDVTIYKSDLSKEKRILKRIRSATHISKIEDKPDKPKNTFRSCNNNKKCTHVDFNIKCKKHELFYCKYQTMCQICNETISDHVISRHYILSHKAIIYKSNTNITINNKQGWILLENIGCLAICYYRIEENNNFKINVYIPAPTVHLKNYVCVVYFADPSNIKKLFKTCKLIQKFDTLCDWIGDINLKEFQNESKQVNFSIEIKKVNKFRSLINT